MAQAEHAAPTGESLIPDTTGERLRFIRQRRRLSQSELARQVRAMDVKVNPSLISRFELYGSGDPNERRPNFAQVVAMAVVLQVKPRQILGEAIEDYPELRLIAEYPEFATLEKASRQTTRRRPRSKSKEPIQHPLIAPVRRLAPDT